jgi:site-specific recombinase XerD
MTPESSPTIGQRMRIKDFSPHDLRRSYLSNLFDAGADLPAVQRPVDYASVNTASRYNRHSEAAAKKGARMINL